MQSPLIFRSDSLAANPCEISLSAGVLRRFRLIVQCGERQVRRLTVSFGYLLCLLGSLAGGALQAEAKQPNIVLILTDDQCFDTIAALGNTEIITPSLDALSRRGVSFRNAYNMGGWHGAICVASRTMMNTGRFIWDAYPLDNQAALANEANHGRFLSQTLRKAGYETYMSGKWHVQIDPKEIFDHVRHKRPGMPPTTPASYSRPSSKDNWLAWDPEQKGYWTGGKHWSEVLADDAVGYLGQAAESEKPFFMYLAFNAPHDPRQAPREYVEMYQRESLGVPDNFLPEYPYMEPMGAGKTLRDERLAPWPRTEAAVRLHRQEYYALITHMDAQIGRILAELARQGMGEDTYVVMTSDHGLACGQHGLLGKQNMYEHSMKAPLIVTGPDVRDGIEVDTPVYIQDFHTTALQWAGITPPEHVQFKSLQPLLDGETIQQYETIYGAYRLDRQRMIRHGDLKLIHYPVGDAYRLFDLGKDPSENFDLADSPDHAKTLNRLKQRMQQSMIQMRDPLVEATGVRQKAPPID